MLKASCDHVFTNMVGLTVVVFPESSGVVPHCEVSYTVISLGCRFGAYYAEMLTSHMVAPCAKCVRPAGLLLPSANTLRLRHIAFSKALLLAPLK